jgi:hypothetical protein
MLVIPHSVLVSLAGYRCGSEPDTPKYGSCHLRKQQSKKVSLSLPLLFSPKAGNKTLILEVPTLYPAEMSILISEDSRTQKRI